MERIELHLFAILNALISDLLRFTRKQSIRSFVFFENAHGSVKKYFETFKTLLHQYLR